MTLKDVLRDPLIDDISPPYVDSPSAVISRVKTLIGRHQYLSSVNTSLFEANHQALVNVRDLFEQGKILTAILNLHQYVSSQVSTRLTKSIQGAMTYRIRCSDSPLTNVDEMLHHKSNSTVPRNRFSFPGINVLYSGNSPEICFLEKRIDISKEDLSKVYISRIEFDLDQFTGLGLGILPLDALVTNVHNVAENQQAITEYFETVLPLVIETHRKSPDNNYKQEYLIPQLLMGVARELGHGFVRYQSTHFQSHTATGILGRVLSSNYATFKTGKIPIRVTEPVSVQQVLSESEPPIDEAKQGTRMVFAFQRQEYLSYYGSSLYGRLIRYFENGNLPTVGTTA